MDLKESELLGEEAANHWYYRCKALAMMRCLEGRHPSAILDVGAGSGFFSRHLLRHGSAQSAVCVDTGYRGDHDDVVAGKPISFRRTVDRIDADLVLLMDVLEHVDDDVGLLSSYVGRVDAGALFLLTVPAHQWLWSGHDVFLEHRRRYSLDQLKAVVDSARLRILRIHYFFALVLPMAAAVRLGRRVFAPNAKRARASQLVHHGPGTNLLLSWICRAELPLMRYNHVAGLSVFCVAQKVG
jgi:SAM-dependent methyltransferase